MNAQEVKVLREVFLTPGQPSSFISLSPFQNIHPLPPKIEPPCLHRCSDVRRPKAVFHWCSPWFSVTVLMVPSCLRATCSTCWAMFTCLKIHIVICHPHAIVISKESSFPNCSSLKSLNDTLTKSGSFSLILTIMVYKLIWFLNIYLLVSVRICVSEYGMCTPCTHVEVRG